MSRDNKIAGSYYSHWSCILSEKFVIGSYLYTLCPHKYVQMVNEQGKIDRD